MKRSGMFSPTSCDLSHVTNVYNETECLMQLRTRPLHKHTVAGCAALLQSSILSLNSVPLYCPRVIHFLFGSPLCGRTFLKSLCRLGGTEHTLLQALAVCRMCGLQMCVRYWKHYVNPVLFSL